MSLIKCPECGGTVSDTAATCPHCGAPIIKCKECGEILPGGTATCPHCGAPADVVYEKEETAAPVQRPSTPNGSHRSTSKTVIIVVAAILLFLFLTCPKTNRHEQVIEDRISMAIDDMRDSTAENDAWNSISSAIVTQVTKAVLNNGFSVDNYLIFSVGKMHWNYHDTVVTFGIAHHVFCFLSKEDIQTKVRQMQKDRKRTVTDFFSSIKNLFGIESSDNESESDTIDYGTEVP